MIGSTILVYRNNIFPLFLIILAIGFSAACATDDKNISLEQHTQAQSNIISDSKQNNQKFDFLNPSVDLCRFQSTDLGNKEGDKEIYELINAGFPEDTPIEEGIAIFNKMEKCYKSNQPPLDIKEFKDALNREVCEKYTRYNDDVICYKRKRVIEEGHFLKGSFLESGTMETDKNIVNPEGIWLYMERDKHRRDLKDELIFPFLIRKFPSAKK